MVANSYGIANFKFETSSDLEANLDVALNYSGPALLEIVVTEDENCYPMVAPGKSNSQMMGIFKRNEEINKVVN
jgi:acetolactate synthase-1/2/3 large subunit